MKKLLIMLPLMLFVGLLQAQEVLRTSRVMETSKSFTRKASGNALTITIQGQPKNVENVLSDLFESKTGKRGRKAKGLNSFPGVMMGDVSSSTMDLFFKVEKGAKGSNNTSLVSLFMSAGEGNFYSSDTHPEAMEAATQILEDLELDVKIYEFKLMINDQKKLISKEQKNFNNLVQDSVKLEKRLAETIESIDQNKIDRANQILKIEEEERRLDDFRLELAKLEEEDSGIAAPQKPVDELTPIIQQAEEGKKEKDPDGTGGRYRR